MGNLTRSQKFLILVAAYFLLQGSSGIGGSSPSFESQADGKPCIYVSADLSPEGNKGLGKTHPGIITAVAKWVKANKAEYRLDDTNATADPGDGEDDWVKAAHKVADRTHPPSIVGSSKTKGFKAQPLPHVVDDLNKLLDRIKP